MDERLKNLLDKRNRGEALQLEDKAAVETLSPTKDLSDENTRSDLNRNKAIQKNRLDKLLSSRDELEGEHALESKSDTEAQLMESAKPGLVQDDDAKNKLKERMLDMRNPDLEPMDGDATKFNEGEPRNMLANFLGMDSMRMSEADKKRNLQDMSEQMGMAGMGSIAKVGKVLPKAVINSEFNRIKDMISAKLADKAAGTTPEVQAMLDAGKNVASKEIKSVYRPTPERTALSKTLKESFDGPAGQEVMDQASTSAVRKAEAELANRANSAGEVTQNIAAPQRPSAAVELERQKIKEILDMIKENKK